MQVEYIHVVHAQPPQATVQRIRGGLCDVAALGLGEPDLGADKRSRLQLCPNPAKIGLRRAVAVLHRRVEVVDAGFQCPRDRTLLIRLRAAHHQPPTAPQPKPNTETRIPVRPKSRISIEHPPVYRAYSPASRARTFINPTTISNVGAFTPVARAISSGASKMPSISIGRPNSRSCKIDGL